MLEYLAEKLMMNKRCKDKLGPCRKYECLWRWRRSDRKEPMMIAQQHQNAKCVSCGFLTTRDAYVSHFCRFCQDNYCHGCMAYEEFFDMQELEIILK